MSSAQIRSSDEVLIESKLCINYMLFVFLFFQVRKTITFIYLGSQSNIAFIFCRKFVAFIFD